MTKEIVNIAHFIFKNDHKYVILLQNIRSFFYYLTCYNRLLIINYNKFICNIKKMVLKFEAISDVNKFRYKDF